MDQLALQVTGDCIVPWVGSFVFDWLRSMSSSLYYSIRRWWGGDQGEKKVWNAYKDARKILMDQERDNGMRLILIRDLRTEFRLTYPAYSDLFN
jgi:hypothetical protein